jgi:hypothetical protein
VLEELGFLEAAAPFEEVLRFDQDVPQLLKRLE